MVDLTTIVIGKKMFDSMNEDERRDFIEFFSPHAEFEPSEYNVQFMRIIYGKDSEKAWWQLVMIKKNKEQSS